MTKSTSGGNGIWALTRNVLLCASAIELALNRSPNSPQMIGYYGRPGLGKTMSASYCANKFDGIYVAVRSVFTATSFMQALLKEMGLRPGRTKTEMLDQIVEYLKVTKRMLIIDEFDFLVGRAGLEVVRDIQESCHSVILLIGESNLPNAVQRASGRFYDRFLIWQPAQPADLGDARKYASFYCRGIEISDDLLLHFLKGSDYVARRLCVNLEHARMEAQSKGVKALDLAAWGDAAVFYGKAPMVV